MGGKVYVGGGDVDKPDMAYSHIVFKYHEKRNIWFSLPPCPTSHFGLSQFQGHLITVGGYSHGEPTGKVFTYNEVSQWEEYLKPMPTARVAPSIVTSESAIVACGRKSTIVEVYVAKTEQWHTADPLPIPCTCISSVFVDGNCYIMGMNDDRYNPPMSVFCAQLSYLIHKATSHKGSSSVWESLPDTPLTKSTAASLNGSLIAVGGYDIQHRSYEAVHMFLPSTNTWATLHSKERDLPVPVYASTVVEMPNNRLLVCGGWDKEVRRSKLVFIGLPCP